jgi:putative peptidoglycan lipid II flippase
MLLYQLTFIARDNIASRLALGSVSALTYGWMILQVPETLIGTAIGTALLPTISEQYAKRELAQFKETISKIQRVLIALTVPSAILLAMVLYPFLEFAFGFDAENTRMMLWVTRAFLAGLLSHCMLELGARIYFAKQNALIPLIGSAINLVVYIASGALMADPLGAPGLALADAASFTAQSVFLFLIYAINSLKEAERPTNFGSILGFFVGEARTRSTWLRTLLGSLAGSAVILIMLRTLQNTLPSLVLGILAAFAGMLIALSFIRKELKTLIRL